jgi:Ca2+-binding EF-hand superfamily protein
MKKIKEVITKIINWVKHLLNKDLFDINDIAGIKAYLEKAGIKISLPKLESIIANADVDSNGKISVKEIIKYISSNKINK